MATPASSNRERSADHAPQGVLEAAVGDQAGRQVEQHAGLALAPLGLGPAALAARHQQADHDGHEQVDGQRQVVLGSSTMTWRKTMSCSVEDITYC